jgi:TolB-like protein/DNA-binding SARP family transcriptional activator
VYTVRNFDLAMDNSDQPRFVRFGAFTFDPLAGELRKQGRKLKLQGQPIEILAMLLGRPGEIITREELQKRLWPENTFVDFEHSLNAAVKRLRDTLDDSAEAPRYVETLARRGYRFIAPVEDTGLFHRFDARGETIDSMAVLPFVNASSNPDTEYLTDGIAESLINSLSQLPRLKVMSRDSAFRYKGKETDAETVGRQLRVRTVFKGRITQRDSSVAIGVELIDARDNSQIWGQRYDRKLADILVLQDEIAKEITTALRLRLTGAEEKRLAKRYTENAEAYQLYLKGRYYWNKRTKDAARKGVSHFQQAIDQDPNYARAYAGLADSYYVLGYYSALPPKEAFPKAKAAAMKALEFDDSLAEGHAALAVVIRDFDWDWAKAEKEFNRAIELNPRYASAYEWCANLFTAVGRREEGLTQMKRAQEMDPLSLIINADLGRTFYFARDCDQSLEQLRRALEMDPNFGLAHVFLGQVYVQKGMFEKAISEFQEGIVLSSGSTYALARRAHTYAVAGQRGEAQKELNRLKELSEQEYVSPYDIAVIYVGLGEKDQAFAWLERAYENRSPWLVYLKVEPALDPLRSDPRFADLLCRMNLQ